MSRHFKRIVGATAAHFRASAGRPSIISHIAPPARDGGTCKNHQEGQAQERRMRERAGAGTIGCGEQLPTRPELSHDWPAGDDGSAQQASSTQCPDRQSCGWRQLAPFGAGVLVGATVAVSVVAVALDVAVAVAVALFVRATVGVWLGVVVGVSVGAAVSVGFRSRSPTQCTAQEGFP